MMAAREVFGCFWDEKRVDFCPYISLAKLVALVILLYTLYFLLKK